MLKNNTFNNLKHGMVHLQWDNYRSHELNSDDDPYINKNELKVLLRLKYHHELQTSWDDYDYKYPIKLVPLLKLHLIKYSIKKDDFDDKVITAKLTHLGHQYIDSIAPKHEITFSHDHKVVEHLRAQNDNELGTDYAWRYNGGLVGLVVGSLITLIGFMSLISLLELKHLMRTSSILLMGIAILFTVALITGIIVQHCIKNSLRYYIRQANFEYKNNLHKEKIRRIKNYVRRHHARRSNFIEFLSKDNRWQQFLNDVYNEPENVINYKLFKEW